MSNYSLVCPQKYTRHNFGFCYFRTAFGDDIWPVSISKYCCNTWLTLVAASQLSLKHCEWGLVKYKSQNPLLLYQMDLVKCILGKIHSKVPQFPTKQARFFCKLHFTQNERNLWNANAIEVLSTTIVANAIQCKA